MADVPAHAASRPFTQPLRLANLAAGREPDDSRVPHRRGEDDQTLSRRTESASSGGSRLRAALHLLALGALAAGMAVAGHDLINAFPYGLTDDDAWFYARIAYELGATGGPTFDGIHPTSGFHLLWGGFLGLVSAALGVFTADPQVHLHAYETVYLFIALLVAWTFTERLADRFAMFTLTIVSTMLMETILVGALLLAFLRLSHEDDATPARRALALAALALVPLARIDAAVIPMTLAAFLLATRRHVEAVRIAAAVAVGAIVQLVLMLAIFGHPFSVSSMIKATNSLPGPGTLLANLAGPEPIAPGFVLRALIFATLAAAVFVRPLRDYARDTRGLGIAAGACVFTLVHLVAHRIPFWCYLPAYMVFFHLVSRGDRRDLLRRATSLAVPALLAVFLADKLLDLQRNRAVVQGAREFVTQVSEAVPPHGRIYQVDGTGFVNFFSARHIVNGDGLVNTYAYAERAQQGTLAGYLDEEGICFVIDNVDRGDSPFIVDFGGLVVRRTDVEEVLRTGTYGRHRTTDFVLYRRRAETCAPEP